MNFALILIASALPGCGDKSEGCGPGFEDDGSGYCYPVGDSGEPGDDGGDDSGEPGGDDSDDTVDGGGGDDTGDGPVDDDNATLSEGGVVSCADPTLREDQPFTTPAMGADWAVQPFEVPDGESAAGGITVADLDGDGRYDVVLPHWEGSQIFMGQPDGTFADETAARWPAGVTPNSSAAIAADVEGDGDLDLYVCDAEGDDFLLINDGSGHFSDGTAAAGLAGNERRCLSASFADMDGDEDLDLFVADYDWCGLDEATGDVECERPPETIDDPRQLFENQGDGTFADVSERLPLERLAESLMHVPTWIDLDLDGDLDLLIANDAREEIEWAQGNLIFLNNGDGTFEDVTEGSGFGIKMAAMGVGVGDINGDLLPDLFVSDLGRVLMLETLGPLDFYDTTLVRGLQVTPSEDARWSGWGAELVDFDNDGLLDATMLFGYLPPDVHEQNPPEQPDLLHMQGEDGVFVDMAEALGVADLASGRGLVTIDVSGDGYPDLFKAFLDGPAVLYESNCGDAAWLEVRLHDPGPNPFAVGATVYATVGERTRMRWIFAGGTGFQSSYQPLAHFGLGDADAVDALTVVWPDGETSTFYNVSTRQSVTVSRVE
jgi:hypothetical protein